MKVKKVSIKTKKKDRPRSLQPVYEMRFFTANIKPETKIPCFQTASCLLKRKPAHSPQE